LIPRPKHCKTKQKPKPWKTKFEKTIYNIIFKSKLIFINILCIYIYMWNICKFCWKINT
jgi:hypothetical protein